MEDSHLNSKTYFMSAGTSADGMVEKKHIHTKHLGGQEARGNSSAEFSGLFHVSVWF